MSKKASHPGYRSSTSGQFVKESYAKRNPRANPARINSESGSR